MRGLRSTAASLPLRQADLRDMNLGATPQPHLMSEGQPLALYRLSVRSQGSRPGTRAEITRSQCQAAGHCSCTTGFVSACLVFTNTVRHDPA